MKARPDVPSIGAAASPLLQELGDVLELGGVTLDGSLVVCGCNRRLAAAIGVAETDLIGRSISDIFDGLAGSPAEQAFRRAVNGVTAVWPQQFHGFLLPLTPPPGHENFEQMQQSARIAPVLREGAVDGVLALVQDVTERVAREQALRRALQAAEVASQAKPVAVFASSQPAKVRDFEAPPIWSIHVRFDTGAAGFCLLATLLFALGPALKHSRADIVSDLKFQSGDDPAPHIERQSIDRAVRAEGLYEIPYGDRVIHVIVPRRTSSRASAPRRAGRRR